MDSFVNQINNVLAELNDIKLTSDGCIATTSASFDGLRETLLNSGQDTITATQADEIKKVLHQVNVDLQNISLEHQKIHTNVNRLGKAIDNNFVSDFGTVTRPDFLEDENDATLMNKQIAKYYNARGHEDIALSLIGEARIPDNHITEILQDKDLAQINIMNDAILKHNLDPVFEWVNENSSKLATMKSNLEFKLHKMIFTQIIAKGISGQAEAIVYARTHFEKFAGDYAQQIQELMGSLIYLSRGIENSPYKRLISPDMWYDLSYTFVEDACTLYDINKNSSLFVIVDSGCTALVPLLRIQEMLPPICLRKNELPIAIDLRPEYLYHSTFVCPVLKQATDENNPPMRLDCGHVISHWAYSQLIRRSYLICPCCLTKQKYDKAKQVFF